MAVSFANFKIKYAGFVDLTEPQFTQFLPDVIAEVDRYKWQLLGANFAVFRDQAIENLLACRLSRLNPEYLGSAGLAAFEVREAGFRVQYLSNSGGSKNNPFCEEYQRLLDAVAALNTDASQLPACTRGVVKNVYWG